MADPQVVNENSSAVRTHVEVLQSVIQRMADNSRSCKVWCVTLVSATLVLVARTGESQHALIAVTPAVLFYVLDAYYLALERGFRRSYCAFVKKVHSQQIIISDLYSVGAGNSIWRGTLWAMFRSFSVLPFYAMVMATVLLAWRVVL